MANPWALRMRDNVIGFEKSKEFSKSLWEYKVKKRAGEAQGKQTGLGCLRENKWDTGASRWCNKRTNSYIGPLGEE